MCASACGTACRKAVSGSVTSVPDSATTGAALTCSDANHANCRVIDTRDEQRRFVLRINRNGDLPIGLAILAFIERDQCMVEALVCFMKVLFKKLFNSFRIFKAFGRNK